MLLREPFSTTARFTLCCLSSVCLLPVFRVCLIKGGQRMSSETRSKIFIATALLALIGFTPRVFAQTIDGNLVGTVVDPSGAIVPNATVEIANTATGIKTTTKTGPDGLYRF